LVRKFGVLLISLFKFQKVQKLIQIDSSIVSVYLSIAAYRFAAQLGSHAFVGKPFFNLFARNILKIKIVSNMPPWRIDG
jgi:hypothetical protein